MGHEGKEPEQMTAEELDAMRKDAFIDLALQHGMLLFGKEPFSLKSGRQSRLFFNAGNADHGAVVEALEDVYARMMATDVGDKPVVCFGLPYKCINVASHAAAGLAKLGKDARWNTYRKEEKGHGGDAKSILVARGDNIRMCGGRVAMIDDVITTGASKSEALEVLEQLAQEDGFPLDVIGVYLMVDRQEVTADNPSESAVAQFQKTTGIRTKAYVTATELIEAAKKRGLIDDAQYRSFLTYFRVYGAPEVMAQYRGQMRPEVLQQSLFMPVERSVVPACDFESIELLEGLAKAIADVDKIGGLKVGSLLVKRHGLGRVVEVVKKHAPKKKVIHDYQKCGTDIAEMVYKQVRQDAELGCDATIVFPLQGGPEALLAAIHAGYEHGINVVVGGEMTHQGFLRSEGGCVSEEDSDRFYMLAASRGVRNFVMPGTKPDRIKHYREMLAAAGAHPISILSPGFVTQGGNISVGGRAAGDFYHAIVGRAIYEKSPGQYRTPDEMRAEALKLTAKL